MSKKSATTAARNLIAAVVEVAAHNATIEQAPAPVQAPSGATLYVLSEVARGVAEKVSTTTKQAKELGVHQKAWRDHSVDRTNTRALSLATILATFGENPFTEAQVKALWSMDKAGFGGSATPASRIRAFKLNKYFVEHNPA